MFNANKTTDQLINWLQKWFADNGPRASAIVGISGGKDSSITAALLTRALGRARVFGAIMPNGKMKDIEIAKRLAAYLKIDCTVIDVARAVEGIYEGIAAAAGQIPELARINTPARMRMAVLYALTTTFPNGARVANTCNLSEDWVGYATKYGDGAGDFSPLSGLTVTEVKAIGRALGLPAEFVDKTPEDGLCGKTDEESLGFTYAILDRYIRTGEIDDPELGKRIDALRAANLHKVRFMDCFNPHLKIK